MAIKSLKQVHQRETSMQASEHVLREVSKPACPSEDANKQTREKQEVEPYLLLRDTLFLGQGTRIEFPHNLIFKQITAFNLTPVVINGDENEIDLSTYLFYLPTYLLLTRLHLAYYCTYSNK